MTSAARTAAPAARTRDRVLEVVRGCSPQPVTIAAVADAVGVHGNTARFHLENLARQGEVEAGTASTAARGRPARVFRAAPPPAAPRRAATGLAPRHRAAPNADARLLAEILLADIADGEDARARADSIGRRWGARAVAGGMAGQAAHADTGGSAAVGAAAGETELGQAEAGGAEGRSTQAPGLDPLLTLMAEAGFEPEYREDVEQIDLRRCPFAELIPEYGSIVCAMHSGIIEGALAATEHALEALTPFTAPTTCTATLTRRAS